MTQIRKKTIGQYETKQNLTGDEKFLIDDGGIYFKTNANSIKEFSTDGEINQIKQDLIIISGTVETLSGTVETLSNVLEKSYIGYYDFSSESVTQIDFADTWYKLNTNTQSDFSRNGLVHSNNRVTNTGSTKIVKVEAIASVSSAPNRELHLSFHKNDILLPCTEQSNFTGSGTRIVALPIHCITELDTGDYVEVWVKNATGPQDVTIDNINVIITEL